MSEPQEDAPQQVGVMVSASVQKSPDGQFWVGIHVSTTQTNYVAVFSIAQAEKIRDDFPGILTEAINQAKRDARGLTIASADALNLLKGDRK